MLHHKKQILSNIFGGKIISSTEKNNFKVENQDCSEIRPYDLEDYDPKEDAIIKACEITKDKFSNLNKDLINAQLKQILLPTSVSITKSKIIGGITNFVSNFLVTELVSKKMENHYLDENKKTMKPHQLLAKMNDHARNNN